MLAPLGWRWALMGALGLGSGRGSRGCEGGRGMPGEEVMAHGGSCGGPALAVRKGERVQGHGSVHNLERLLGSAAMAPRSMSTGCPFAAFR